MAVNKVTFEVPSRDGSGTAVEFSSRGYKVLRKGSEFGYLHIPMERVETVVPHLTTVVVGKGNQYSEDGYHAKVTRDKQTTFVRGELAGSRVTIEGGLLWFWDNKARMREFDKTAKAVMEDGRTRVLKYKDKETVVEFKAGRLSGRPSDALVKVIAEYWANHPTSLPGLGASAAKWAFQGRSHAEVEALAGKQVFLASRGNLTMNRQRVARELVRLAKGLVARRGQTHYVDRGGQHRLRFLYDVDLRGRRVFLGPWLNPSDENDESFEIEDNGERVEDDRDWHELKQEAASLGYDVESDSEGVELVR